MIKTEQLEDKYKIIWKELHANIFSDLIKEYNSVGLKYFILRNYETLPENNLSKDVDIIIEPGSYSRASQILKEIFRKHEITFHRVVKYEKVRCWYGMDMKKNFSIHIDLIEGYSSKGFEIFSFKELYENTIRYKDFRVLNESYDAVLLLYYKVIGSKQLKERYQKKILESYKKSAEKINRILQGTLNKRFSSNLIVNLKQEKLDNIVDDAQLLSRISKIKVFKERPLKTVFGIGNFIIEKFHRIIICPRKHQNFVAVLGADGTGKTTFIDGLTEAIAYYNVSELSKSHIYHHRPSILPNLGAVGEKVGVMKEDKDFTNPHRAQPAGFLGSLIRMTYYWLDYAIGTPLMLRRDVQFDRFTIYDRYIYDFLIDPGRSRINLPYSIRKIFTRLVIQPRIVFILLTDAETIYSRKQELKIPEIYRQLAEFKKLSESNNRFVVLDASQNPEEIVSQAMHVITHKFALKIE